MCQQSLGLLQQLTLLRHNAGLAAVDQSAKRLRVGKAGSERALRGLP